MAWIRMMGSSNGITSPDMALFNSYITEHSRGSGGGTASTTISPNITISPGKYIVIFSILSDAYAKHSYWGSNNTSLISSITWGTGVTATLVGEITNYQYADYSSCYLHTYMYYLEVTTNIVPTYVHQCKVYYYGGDNIYFNILKISDSIMPELVSSTSGLSYTDTQSASISTSATLPIADVGNYLIIAQSDLGGQGCDSSTYKRLSTNTIDSFNLSATDDVSIKKTFYDSTNTVSDYTSSWIQLLSVQSKSSGNIMLNSSATSVYKPELRLGLISVALNKKADTIIVSTVSTSSSLAIIKVDEMRDGEVMKSTQILHSSSNTSDAYVTTSYSNLNWKVVINRPCSYNGTTYEAGNLSISWAYSDTKSYTIKIL